MARLNGKVAIITGAARGAGAVIARVFVEEGAKVVLVDVLDEAGEQLAQDLGGDARYVHCDISQEADWEVVVATTTSEFGGIDVLVNNAAVLHIAPLVETTPEDFMRIMEVNALGTFLGIRAVARPMKERGGGSIVNITSISSLEGTPLCVAYVGSKWAIRGITRTAAMELGQYGIRVTALNPCAANPEMIMPFLADILPRFSGGGGSGQLAASTGSSPLRHDDTADERFVANAQNVVFLASDDGRYFSGVDVDPSSGTTASYLPYQAMYSQADFIA